MMVKRSNPRAAGSSRTRTTKVEGTTPAAVLASLPPERARELAAVRAAIRLALPPGYEEVAQKGMIVYQVPRERYPNTYNGHPLWLAALAAPKRYLTLHLMPVYGSATVLRRLEEGFTKAGKRLRIGKACIQFQCAEDLALDAIEDVVAAMPVEKWIGVAQSVQSRPRRGQP
jgi:hypothetical protein